METQISTAEVLNEVRKGLRAYKLFEHFEKVLVYMGSLEQRERETAGRVEKAVSQALHVEQECAERVRHAETNADAAEIRATAAHRHASEAEKLAEVNAKRIVQDAVVQAKDIQHKANALREAVMAEVDEARQALLSVRGQVADAQAELVHLNTSISEAQDKIHALLGAARKK